MWLWDILTERARGIAEAVVGALLMSTSYWSMALERAVDLAHEVTAIGGALIVVHGILRAFRHEYRNWQQKRIILRRNANR